MAADETEDSMPQPSRAPSQRLGHGCLLRVWAVPCSIGVACRRDIPLDTFGDQAQDLGVQAALGSESFQDWDPTLEQFGAALEGGGHGAWFVATERAHFSLSKRA